MITIFYGAYPNEITYSWFARYLFINGDITYSTTSRELFGKDYVDSKILYPINMNYFIKQLPVEWNIGVDEIIYENTIIPLFTPFMEKERANRVVNNILIGDTRRLKGEIGLNTGNVFIEEPNIKICPICYEEDKEKYGQAYIHRNHQVMGNYICNNHGNNLHKYNIPYNINRCEYVDINKINVEEYEIVTINELYKNLHLNLSKDIDSVLNGGLKEYRIGSIEEKYKNRLKEIGFLNFGGKFLMKKIIKLFNEFYPKEFLESLESYIDIEKRKNWISIMLTNTGSFIHPIRHLLFIRFLFGGIEEFLNYEKCFEFFVEPPWLCLNPVCKYYEKPVINEVKYKNKTHHGKPVGVFTCECGYSYSRVGPDKNESDRNRIGKIEEFGWHWEKVLKNLVENGCSIREITKRMCSCTSTIIKQATKLGIVDQLNTKHRINYKEQEKVYSEEKVNLYKDKILLFIKENKIYSRQKVRETLTKECSLVYIRDKDWWDENLPKPIKKSRFSKDYKDIDWEERERELYPLILKAIEEIKNEEEPIRITRTCVMKKTGKTILANKGALDRIPKIKELLEKNCETIEEFKQRKIIMNVISE